MRRRKLNKLLSIFKWFTLCNNCNGYGIIRCYPNFAYNYHFDLKCHECDGKGVLGKAND